MNCRKWQPLRRGPIAAGARYDGPVGPAPQNQHARRLKASWYSTRARAAGAPPPGQSSSGGSAGAPSARPLRDQGDRCALRAEVVRIRASKTNPEAEHEDFRLLVGPFARGARGTPCRRRRAGRHRPRDPAQPLPHQRTTPGPRGAGRPHGRLIALRSPRARRRARGGGARRRPRSRWPAAGGRRRWSPATPRASPARTGPSPGSSAAAVGKRRREHAPAGLRKSRYRTR